MIDVDLLKVEERCAILCLPGSCTFHIVKKIWTYFRVSGWSIRHFFGMTKFWVFAKHNLEISRSPDIIKGDQHFVRPPFRVSKHPSNRLGPRLCAQEVEHSGWKYDRCRPVEG